MRDGSIVLSTFNARYIHPALGLRYLEANLGELSPRARRLEFLVGQRPVDAALAIANERPAVVGLGVYVWNVDATAQLVSILRRVLPGVVLVVGGPEVSHELDGLSFLDEVDLVLQGEADLAFASVCRAVLEARALGPKVQRAEPPPLEGLLLPYGLYDDEDVAHRHLYIEASRGCPYRCAFCLSARSAVRTFDLDQVLGHAKALLERGARSLKFVDRTFNLDLDRSRRILEFLAPLLGEGQLVHFELVPDRLPDELREVIAAFRPGTLQLEVGVQTLEPEVERRVDRAQHHGRLEDNLRWLSQSGAAHVHADLIAGLPGETLETFARGFDRLYRLGPDEIQLGLLKRLRGTATARTAEADGLVFSPHAPYELLRSRELDFPAVQRLRRTARFWDLFVNSGQLKDTMRLFLGAADSPLLAFMDFADELHAKLGSTEGIALTRKFELAHELLSSRLDQAALKSALEADYRRAGKSDHPAWAQAKLHQRQARHRPRGP